MRRIGVFVLSVLVLAGAGLGAAGYYSLVFEPRAAASARLAKEQRVFSAMRDSGLSKSYAAIEGDELLMRFEAPAVNPRLSDVLVGLAATGLKEVGQVKIVEVQAYLHGDPLIGLRADAEDIRALMDNRISLEDFNRRASPTDARGATDRMRAEFNLFGALVRDVSLELNQVSVEIEQFGADEPALWADLVAMSASAFGWVDDADSVKFSLIGSGGADPLTVTVYRQDMAALVAESLTPQAFAEAIVVNSSNISASEVLGRYYAALISENFGLARTFLDGPAARDFNPYARDSIISSWLIQEIAYQDVDHAEISVKEETISLAGQAQSGETTYLLARADGEWLIVSTDASAEQAPDEFPIVGPDTSVSTGTISASPTP